MECCYTGDLTDFFLNLPTHMRVHCRCVPQEVSDKEHELMDDCFNSTGRVCLEIRKGMHGLKGAAVLACNQLMAHAGDGEMGLG
jgi:hypothetical protein